jgi:hypothetical protein
MPERPPQLSSTFGIRMRCWSYITIACLTCAAGCNPGGSDAPPRTSEPKPKVAATMPAPSHRESAPDPAEGMRKLRQRALTAAPADFGLQPTSDFPQVYGAVAEFPMDDGTLTIVSLRDGNASLYTTGTFGIIGGYAHERVRAASVAFVRAAQGHHDAAVAATDFPYPTPGRVRFYLLTFKGVRVIDTDLSSLEAGTSVYSALFARGNEVITELRKIATK